MIIKAIMENTSVSDDFQTEHGLSVYVETQKHHILFDTGASGKFASNAVKMGVDLASVDIAVISHDHYDHGGGLQTFLDINKSARIYISGLAFGDRFSKDNTGVTKYIGLEKSISSAGQITATSEHMAIDDELELFSGVKAKKLTPSGNKDLLMMCEGTLCYDDFTHEQNLIIRDKGNVVLFAGCAHNGIVNIIEHMKAAGYGTPSHVIGGFHLYNKSADRFEDPGIIRQIGEYLRDTGAMYYTCHCTGIEPYNQLKMILGDRIGYLAAGGQITI